MKLNIIKQDSHNISVKFGISEQRAQYLCYFVGQIYEQVKSDMLVPLVSVYQKLANECTCIEEYTMCMHMLIFNLSKIGKPHDDMVFNN